MSDRVISLEVEGEGSSFSVTHVEKGDVLLRSSEGEKFRIPHDNAGNVGIAILQCLLLFREHPMEDIEKIRSSLISWVTE